MKKFAVICLLMFTAMYSHGQSYNDMFTTYKSVPTPKPTPTHGAHSSSCMLLI